MLSSRLLRSIRSSSSTFTISTMQLSIRIIRFAINTVEPRFPEPRALQWKHKEEERKPPQATRSVSPVNAHNLLLPFNCPEKTQSMYLARLRDSQYADMTYLIIF